MKRIVSLIVALSMLLTLTAAFAEDANQAAFTENLKSMLNRVDLTKNALTLEADGKTYATLQAKDGVYDLNIPDVADLQLSRDTLWVSANGQVYEIPTSEIEAAFQELYNMFIYGGEPEDTLSAMLGLLVEKVITPGISMDYSTGAIKIHLTGEQMLQGLAEFGDEVVANPDYMNLITVGSNWSSLLSYLMNRSYYRPSPTFTNAEKLAEQWPALKEQILATKSTLVIDGTLTYAADGIKILLTAENNGAEVFRMEGAMTTEEDGTVKTECVITSGSFKYVVSGFQKDNLFHATYDVWSGSQRVFYLALNVYTNGSKITADFMGEVRGTSFTGNAEADLNAGTFALNVDVPDQQAKITLEGAVSDKALTAKLNVTAQGSTVASADLSCALTDDGFTASLTASLPNGISVAFQMAASEDSIVYTATIANGSNYTVNVTGNYQLVEGDIPHFKVEMTQASYGYSSVTGYAYDGEKFTMWSDAMNMTITGKFVSPTEYQLLIDETYSYYGSTSTMNIVASVVLEDAGDTWRIPVTLSATQDGKAAMETVSAALVYGPQTGFEPLAGKVTQTLTKDDLLNLIFPTSTSSYSYSY